MVIRVQDLLDNPTLRTSLVAGEGGVDRLVDWAHATEAERPWEWLGRDELLLTLGRNLPRDSRSQVTFIERLVEAHLAGIDVAEGWFAPRLSKEAIAAANALDFPVIETAYEVPFSLVVRAVAEGTSRTNHVAELLRVYESFRLSLNVQRTEREILSHLAEHLDSQLAIIDVADQVIILSTHESLSAALSTRMKDLISDGRLPSVARFPDGDADLMVSPLPESRYLLVRRGFSGNVNLVVTQHAAAMASLIVDRLISRVTSSVLSDRQLISHLLDGSIDCELAREALVDRGVGHGPWRALSVNRDEPSDMVSLNLQFSTRDITCATASRSSGLVMLIPDSEAVIGKVRSWLKDSRLKGGMSRPIPALSRFSDAIREAVWARAAGAMDREVLAEYGFSDSPFLPSTVSAARSAVDSVLGSVIAYDRAHESELLHSLVVFFAADRSWRTASETLGIHRQTLVYRMQRVEELTDRNLSRVEDIATLHMALRAKALLDDA